MDSYKTNFNRVIKCINNLNKICLDVDTHLWDIKGYNDEMIDDIYYNENHFCHEDWGSKSLNMLIYIDMFKDSPENIEFD